MKKYSVWVGGVEVNDYYLTKDNAEQLANDYINNNFIDVMIEEVK